MIDDNAGGVAGGDGMLEPSQVASETVDAMAAGTFLVLPHKEVGKYFLRKAKDYERWLKGMQRLHSTFGTVMRKAPNISAAKL